jgi:hypothetical protein
MRIKSQLFRKVGAWYIKRRTKLKALLLVNMFIWIFVYGFYAEFKAQPVMAGETYVVMPKQTEEQIKIEGIQEMIKIVATLYGQDIKQALAVAECESQFVSSKTGDVEKGKATSFGLWQFHLHAHPEVSKACALDPVCSTFQAMEHWKAGGQRLWTCYNLKF